MLTLQEITNICNKYCSQKDMNLLLDHINDVKLSFKNAHKLKHKHNSQENIENARIEDLNSYFLILKITNSTFYSNELHEYINSETIKRPIKKLNKSVENLKHISTNFNSICNILDIHNKSISQIYDMLCKYSLCINELMN